MPVAHGRGTGGGGGFAAPIDPELTISFDGQAVFTLPSAVIGGGKICVFVNGTRYELLDDFTLLGTTLTWINVLSLVTTDEFRAVYNSV